MRYSRTFLLLVVLFMCLSGSTAFSQDAPAMETATGPAGLLELEQKGEVTVRALRAWGRLPDQFVALARDMRQQGGIDLLGADLTQVRQWIEQAEAGDAALASFQDELTELIRFMDTGEYLDWSPASAQTPVPAGTLVRSGQKRWMQDADGPPMVAGEEHGASPEQVGDTGDSGQEQVAQTTLPPSAPVDAGPEDGLEFPLNDQVPGTYRVRLQVEGLAPVQVEDEPFFQRRLTSMLPGDPSVLQGEQGFFNRLAEYRTVRPVLEDDVPYNLFLGMATMDTPVVIRVDAPDNPEIVLSEKEIADRVSYRVVGKDVFVYRFSEALGGAEIEFEDSRDGEIRWTPRADPVSSRPVGPRVLGVYMSYRIKKFIGDNELGTLSTSQHRIGWIVTAMPGDVYEHEGVLYAVGQEGTLSAVASTGPASAPENFDFELSEYAMKEGAVRLSDDLRHVAWVDGEEQGQKRVVVNGEPGKWYDDIRGYTLKFTPGGEAFCFEAQLGEKKVPVCNGADGPAFDDIEMVVMSDDGAHLLVGGRVDKLYRVYLNGAQIRETTNRVREGALAADGKAAWIERGRDEQTWTEYALVVDSEGREGQKYTAIHSGLLFTKARSQLYYIAEIQGRDRYLVRDGEELKPTMGYGYKFTVTPDSAYYAYVAQLSDDVRAMVVNGQIGPDFSDIWEVATFSPDSSRHIYEGKKGQEAVLVIDGQSFEHAFGQVEAVRGQTFSPDSQRWAAALMLGNDEYVIVVDGKEFGRGQGSPRAIAFSPDGTRVAWLEKQKNSVRAFLDGQAGPEYRDIYDQEPPQFSPDGRHLVYFAQDADKKFHIVVFGGESRMHEMIPPRATFSDGKAEYLAIDGNRIRRESIPLK